MIDLGGKRVRHLDTPHVPHGWEARVLYEETTGTLLCGDLLAHVGNGPALVEYDIVGPALEAELVSRAMTMAPATGEVLSRLADLEPTTLPSEICRAWTSPSERPPHLSRTMA